MKIDNEPTTLVCGCKVTMIGHGENGYLVAQMVTPCANHRNRGRITNWRISIGQSEIKERNK